MCLHLSLRFIIPSLTREVLLMPCMSYEYILNINKNCRIYIYIYTFFLLHCRLITLNIFTNKYFSLNSVCVIACVSVFQLYLNNFTSPSFCLHIFFGHNLFVVKKEISKTNFVHSFISSHFFY